MKIKTVLFVCLLIFPFFCFAEELEPFSGRVALRIAGEENIKNQIESFISRELRSLGDVVITTDDPRWLFFISAINIPAQDGSVYGIAVSSMVFKFFDNTFILDLVSSDLAEFVALITSGLYEKIVDFNMHLIPSDNIDEICKEIVTNFDINVLKPARDVHDIAVEQLKNMEDKYK